MPAKMIPKIIPSLKLLRFNNHGVLSPVHLRRYSDFIPRRALLYIPGNDERKISKLNNIQVDCAVLDCEDGVALNKKEEARNTIRKILETSIISKSSTDLSVRLNSLDSGLFSEDARTILSGTNLPQTVLIPKVENINQVSEISEEIVKILKGRSLQAKLRLILYIESAQALLNLKDICAKAVELSKSGPFVFDGLVFGSDDFCADIGATRTAEASELLFARQQMILVAKAFKVQVIDIVYIDYKDKEGLQQQALEGYRMGFTGKQVIHPGQVDIVQQAFSPPAEKVSWATELVQLFEEHQKSGKGAFTFKGAMIDRPLLLQAQNILQLAERMSSK